MMRPGASPMQQSPSGSYRSIQPSPRGLVNRGMGASPSGTPVCFVLYFEFARVCLTCKKNIKKTGIIRIENSLKKEKRKQKILLKNLFNDFKIVPLREHLGIDDLPQENCCCHGKN